MSVVHLGVPDAPDKFLSFDCLQFAEQSGCDQSADAGLQVARLLVGVLE
jgi:hypothetical protein